MNKEVETYKLFRQLEAREKRANPYKFYDKDELIDEILKDEDEIERLNNIINKAVEYIEEHPPRKILSIMREQQEEIERLNNIINKAVEYIEEHKYSNMIMAKDKQFGIYSGKELLEILNKGE